MSTICKQDLITALAERLDITKTNAEAFFDALTDTISTKLVEGHEVILTGVGRFKPATRAARSAWNVHSQSLVQYPEKRVIKFTVASGLKDSVAESA